MDDSEYEDEIELVLNLKLPTNIRELYLLFFLRKIFYKYILINKNYLK